ncbi:hypothetical protein HD554DRAFT_1146001 [Boletus coccyginus]|nr:hypothetical protein HD554DRAFT_1146001 [Boletus coccyginus]
MGTSGIPLDKAELLGVLLETLLYGFSLLMFGGTIWTLLYQRSTRLVNRKMLAVACLLLLISTVHLVIHIIRVMYGLILYRDTYPGGPIAYFSVVSQWTFYLKNLVYIAQTVVGDGVILYRCYVVWQSKPVMVFPLLLWCGATGTCNTFNGGWLTLMTDISEVTGFVSGMTAALTTEGGVFGGALNQWITSFWATAFAANLLATLLLIFRIWYINRKLTRLGASSGGSQLRPILQILVDAGAIYSVTLLVALICFVIQSNGQYVVLDMITPIISITFYMVIIRVGLATRAGQTTHPSLGNASVMMDRNIRSEQRHGMRVHITRLTESKIDHGQRSPVGTTSLSVNKSSPDEIGLDGGGEV